MLCGEEGWAALLSQERRDQGPERVNSYCSCYLSCTCPLHPPRPSRLMPTQRMQLCDLWEPHDFSRPPFPHLQNGVKEIPQVRKVKHAVRPLVLRKCALNRSSPQTTTPDTQLMGAHCVPDLGLDAKGIQQGSDGQKSLPWWGLHSSGGSSPELNEQNAACQEGRCCGRELGAVREPVVRGMVVGGVEIVFTETGRKGEPRGSLREERSRQGKGPVQRPWGRNAGVAQGRDEGKE